ncbi:uncharacterized protein LOC121912527 isoform X2 [Thunnus maccoyii]|uniref:uncharacterized protein LOC121912527 isoform X2 n=1 Tax=Thunnus maccoyii TaxID=8240 RepID=UPI001C4C0F29|nr:uncharacterized protein LOC121912527 isoform X2 [Thunnus maccoyii]
MEFLKPRFGKEGQDQLREETVTESTKEGDGLKDPAKKSDDNYAPCGLHPDPPPYPEPQPPPPPALPTAPPTPTLLPCNLFVEVNITPRRGETLPQDLQSPLRTQSEGGEDGETVRTEERTIEEIYATIVADLVTMRETAELQRGWKDGGEEDEGEEGAEERSPGRKRGKTLEAGHAPTQTHTCTQSDKEAEVDEILSLQTAEILLSQEGTKPWIVLKVQGKSITVLCDSGACRTVLRHNKTGTDFPLKPNSGLRVRSATGHVTVEPLTEPLKKRDPKTNKNIFASVVVSQLCPVNFLGRDLMTKLGIAVVLDQTGSGMKACRVNLKTAVSDEEDEVETFVHEGLTLNYWYSLDLVQTGPGSVTQELMKLVKDHIPPADMKNVEMYTPEEIHCTMYFRYQHGQDREYHEKFLKEPSCKMTLTELYWDKKGNCACTVSLRESEVKLFRGGLTPHISCSKTLNIKWRDLGDFVSKIERSNCEWQEVRERVLFAPELNVYCTHLNWATQAVKAVHLSGETNLNYTVA